MGEEHRRGRSDHGWRHDPPDRGGNGGGGGGGGGWWRRSADAGAGGGGGGGAGRKKAGRYGKPPRACSGQMVPRWERDFCTSEGSIPWKKLCETKKLMYLYENVAKWDDSEGKEAFQNAKARYWAKIHGIKCDIPLPNSDMYIDVVDQDTIIDPQLIEDLYKKPPPQNRSETETNCFLNLESLNQEVPATGWGDDEEDPLPTKNTENEAHNFGYAPNLIEYEIVPSGWDDVEDSVCETETNCFLNLESLNQEVPATGWGDDEEDPLPMKNTENETHNFGYAPNLTEYEIVPSGWDDVEDSVPKNELKGSDKSWACTGDRPGEKRGNKSYGCNYYKRRNNNWNCHKGRKRMDYYYGQY